MDETYSSTLKSIGVIILTLALFFGVGYYVYETLVAPEQPWQTADAPQDPAPAPK